MRALEVVTIGLPFCAFKVILGMWWMTRPGLSWLGGALALLGLIDLAINLGNLGSLIARGKPASPPCLTAIAAGRWPGKAPKAVREDVGISVDVLLAMSIVAYMIGTNNFSALEPKRLMVWNICVILNVLGAGLSRLGSSLSRAAGAERRAS